MHLLQATFTGLGWDESYYWVYSRFPDWGYFDHPPATPFFIRMGYLLLQNELGVRLFFVFLNTGAIYFLWRLSDREDPWLFFGIVFSTFLVHAGFLSAPDIPLMCFAALFFVLLKQYEERDSLPSALAVGVAIALLLYSKFHGILLIPFTLMA